MSSLYNLEPQPTAKVVLSTTEGDIELSLFAKQIPLASRNFLQHCLDGYYTNTLFHRVVPGFIVQGGDPSGTGSGGEAAINNGEGFERELHSRIKFNRRGLLGIPAVDDGKEVHGSQFFFTLAQTPELEGKCTMLGRVEGDTLYNLMKIGEGVVEDGTDRPMYPAKITGCDVVVNPFEDMVARVKEAPRTKAEKEDTSKGTKKRKKPKGMLSFADEGDQDVQPVKKKKANPNFVDAGPEMPEEMNNTKTPEAPAPKVRPQKMRSPSPARRAPVARPVEASQPQSHSDDEMLDQGPPAVKKSKLDTTNEEIAALKASMKRTIDTGSKEAEKPKSALEAMIPSTTTKGRSKRGKPGDEPGAFDAFQAFKSRLESLPAKNTSKAGAQADAPTTTTTEAPKLGPDDLEETDVCDLHFVANCQSCKAWDEEEEDEDDNDDPTWMVSGLHFPKDTLGKDLEWKKAMADVEVVDTKNSGGK